MKAWAALTAVVLVHVPEIPALNRWTGCASLSKGLQFLFFSSNCQCQWSMSMVLVFL